MRAMLAEAQSSNPLWFICDGVAPKSSVPLLSSMRRSAARTRRFRLSVPAMVRKPASALAHAACVSAGACGAPAATSTAPSSSSQIVVLVRTASARDGRAAATRVGERAVTH